MAILEQVEYKFEKLVPLMPAQGGVFDKMVASIGLAKQSSWPDKIILASPAADN